MKMKYAIINYFVTISFLLSISPAYSHIKCPFKFLGTTNDKCPHLLHEGSDASQSNTMVHISSYYKFRINNETGHLMKYTINGKSYTLKNSHGINHEFIKCRGTNGSNTKCRSKPIIKFDYSYDTGYQAKSYKLGGKPVETFKKKNNREVDIRLGNSSYSGNSTQQQAAEAAARVRAQQQAAEAAARVRAQQQAAEAAARVRAQQQAEEAATNKRLSELRAQRGNASEIIETDDIRNAKQAFEELLRQKRLRDSSN